MRAFDKLIVSCAVTGGSHTPTMSPHLPITPEEIAEAGIEAAEAGASIIHIHVRDPETGEPVSDTDLFRAAAERIRDGCDAIVNPTTGGAPGMSIEERVAVLPELEPELATFNTGSMNYSLHPFLEAIDDWEYDWEPEFLEKGREAVFRNTFADMEGMLPAFEANDTKPEMEVYDVSHLYNIQYLERRDLIEPPYQIQFVMGTLGGIGTDAENLTHLVRIADKLFGDQYSFSVIGGGKAQYPLCSQAISMGGHVRVGMEDNLYLRKGELAESNADMVQKVVEMAYELDGREPATPDETREFLGLKGQDEVGF